MTNRAATDRVKRGNAEVLTRHVPRWAPSGGLRAQRGDRIPQVSGVIARPTGKSY